MRSQITFITPWSCHDRIRRCGTSASRCDRHHMALRHHTIARSASCCKCIGRQQTFNLGAMQGLQALYLRLRVFVFGLSAFLSSLVSGIKEDFVPELVAVEGGAARKSLSCMDRSGFGPVHQTKIVCGIYYGHLANLCCKHYQDSVAQA